MLHVIIFYPNCIFHFHLGNSWTNYFLILFFSSLERLQIGTVTNVGKIGTVALVPAALVTVALVTVIGPLVRQDRYETVIHVIYFFFLDKGGQLCFHHFDT